MILYQKQRTKGQQLKHPNIGSSTQKMKLQYKQPAQRLHRSFSEIRDKRKYTKHTSSGRITILPRNRLHLRSSTRVVPE